MYYWKFSSFSSRFVFSVYLCVLLLGMANFLIAQSSTYRIQVDDQLTITFWEHPNLNTKTSVNKEGVIELPILGRISVSGLTIEDLRNSIISRMAIYNKLVNQLSITIDEYGQNKVFVTGQVAQPGKYSFEKIPGLWDIILEAGGPRETAVLNKVTIVRGDGRGQVLLVNLAEALKNGKLEELPEIKPRDTININGTTEQGIVTSPLAVKEEFYVVGAVGAPGAHQYEKDMNLLEAIGRAGGPTSDANIKNARYVVIENGKTRVVDINLENYMMNDKFKAIPIIRKGSTIYIPHRRELSQVASTIITALITTSITSVIVLVSR